MPGKSRKGSPQRRATSATNADQPRPGVAVPSQANSAVLASNPRPLWLFWLGGLIAALIIVYLALALLAPGTLPSWLPSFNPGALPTPVAQQTVAPSPGGRISFIRSSSDSKKRDIFVVNSDGTNQQQVSQDVYIEGSAAWSPDGTLLLAQASISGISTVVRIAVGADNKPGESVQLTADVKADSVLPVWSPDGKMVAFQSKRDGGDYQVFVMDADGNNKKRLSDGKGYAGNPAWSADGKTVFYVEGDDGSEGDVRELFRASLVGSAPVQITALKTSINHPVVSPKGQPISFLQTDGQYDERILVINPDGTGLRTVIQGGLNEGQSFSPDGKFLTYHKVSPGQGENVFKVSAADGKETSLSKSGVGSYMSTWSPDGSKLAWASKASDTANYKIVVANADGSDQHDVSTGDGNDYQPSWALPSWDYGR